MPVTESMGAAIEVIRNNIEYLKNQIEIVKLHTSQGSFNKVK